MKHMGERLNQLELLTADILQRMDRREANQEKTNKLLSIISVAALVTSFLSFIATFYFVFS